MSRPSTRTFGEGAHLFAAGLLVSLHLAGCGDDTSAAGSGGSGGSGASTTTSTGGAGGATCMSGLEQTDPACTACQDERCCETASAAADRPGTWTTSGAKICREANCADACGVAAPTCGGIEPSPASCTEPLRAACCDELTACATSDACVAIIYLCIDDEGCAPGSACFDTCVEAYADGLPIFEALDTCSGPVFATCG